uniref:Major facilitator superfamily (MFS) profile domain-containing protein n=1 Tax=Heliothis virescens TaxID=7102 RepID=A0A2A4JMT5_HELVI
MCGGDVYFWRQAFILTTGLFYSASVGIMLAYPSVLSPALVSSKGTDIKASSEEASWIDSTGVGGTYGIYGVIVCGCLVLLYYVVPETKDKTLQQIEDGIKGVRRAKCEFETDVLL